MKKNGHVTAFYLETLVLILVFVSIILVLTHVFGLARAASGEARLLTNAVTIAGNAAEAFSAAESPEELCEMLNEAENAELVSEDGTSVLLVRYDRNMHPASGGDLLLKLSMEPEDLGLTRAAIRVYWKDSAEPVYTLPTAVYRKGAAA